MAGIQDDCHIRYKTVNGFAAAVGNHGSPSRQLRRTHRLMTHNIGGVVFFVFFLKKVIDHSP